MPSKIVRIVLSVLVLALVAGAAFGLYQYRSAFTTVKKSSTRASTPQVYTVTNTSPGTDTTLGVSITCSATEVQDQFGNTTGWDVAVNGDNTDASKKSTKVKIHVPWGTALEGQDHVSGTHRYQGPTAPVVVASAETFATPGFGGSLAQCNLSVSGVTPNPPSLDGCEQVTEGDIADAVGGTEYMGLFDRNPASPTNSLRNGSITFPVTMTRTADKGTLTVTLGNATDKCLVASIGVYKMYDGILANQKYFSGKDNITVAANASATVSMPLPSCTAQIDIYGTYPTAPRVLSQSVYPLIAWAYHLSQSDTYRNPTGPVCTEDVPPQGNFESADCDRLVGWAVDRDVPNQTLDVHVYRDGAAGQGGVFVGSFKADKPRSDVNSSLPVSGNHGFDIPTPSVFKDGKQHSIYIYAINPDSGKVNPLLSGSPKTLTCSAPPPPPVRQCKLEITKSVDKTSARPGDMITYTIDVKNSGTADCTGGGVRIEDQYDSRVLFSSETHSANIVRGYSDTSTPFHNISTRTLTWNANTLTPGQSARITWTGTVASISACDEQIIKNSARVTSAEYNNMQTWVTSVPVSTTVPSTCPPPQTNTDVSVAKSVTPSLITVGQTATFTVRVINNGPLPTSKTQIADVLPAGLSLVSATPTKGVFTGGLWDIGALAVQEQQRLSLVVRGDVVGAQVNTARLTATDPQDSDVTNNQAQATVTVIAPAIPDVVCAPANQTITVSQTATLAAVGGNGAYSWSAPEGTPSTATGNTVSVQYVTTGQKTVIVSSGDKQASCTVQVVSPPPPQQSLDLAVTKQVSPAVVQVGQGAVFTVSVQNRTSVTATAVQLTDALPAGLSFVSTTSTQGAYLQTTNVWSVGNLAPGAYATLTLQVATSSVGSFTNTASLFSSTPADADSTNNTASATLLVQSPPTGPAPLVCVLSTNSVFVGQIVTAYGSGGSGTYAWSAPGGVPQTGSSAAFSTGFTSSGQHVIQVQSGTSTAFCNVTVAAPVPPPVGADLSLTKQAAPTSVVVGAQSIFSIVLSNSGPTTADAVTVRDRLPSGLAFVGAVASRGSYDPASGVWNVGQIIPGEKLTLLITVKGDRSGIFTNTAEVWTSNVSDVDSTPGNSNPAEDDQASASVTVRGGLVSAGLPAGPITTLAVLCALAGLLSIRIRTRREVRLQTPAGNVLVAFDASK